MIKKRREIEEEKILLRAYVMVLLDRWLACSIDNRFSVSIGPHESNDICNDRYELLRDLRNVRDSKTDRRAGMAIAYWGCWGWWDTATSFARRLRKHMREYGNTKEKS